MPGPRYLEPLVLRTLKTRRRLESMELSCLFSTSRLLVVLSIRQDYCFTMISQGKSYIPQ